MDGNAAEWVADVYQPLIEHGNEDVVVPGQGEDYEERGLGFPWTRIAVSYHSDLTLFIEPGDDTNPPAHPAVHATLTSGAIPIGVRCAWDVAP